MISISVGGRIDYTIMMSKSKRLDHAVPTIMVHHLYFLSSPILYGPFPVLELFPGAGVRNMRCLWTAESRLSSAPCIECLFRCHTLCGRKIT